MSTSPMGCTKYAPGQECVEGEVGDKDAVEELDDAGKHEEDQERVDRLEPRGGRFVIRLPQREERTLRRASRLGRRCGFGGRHEGK